MLSSSIPSVLKGGSSAFRLLTASNFGSRPYRNKNTAIAWHAAMRPAESSDIDFSTLGLKYVPTLNPEVKIAKYHWTIPPSTKPTGLPFFVERTSVAALPVYTDYKAGRTKVVTIVRRCRGDINALVEDIQKVCDGKIVNVRPGKVVVDGNYHMRLKKYLAGMGF